MKKSSAAWCEIGGKRFYSRSMWERNYARYLQFLKERNEIFDWHYEPKTFWFLEIKRGVRSYKPDFLIESVELGNNYWVEVKGFMDSKSLTKLKRMRIYYPQEIIRVITAKWFADNNQKMRTIIKDWEIGKSCLPKFKTMPKKKYI